MIDFSEAEERCNNIFDVCLDNLNHLLNKLHINNKPSVEFHLSVVSTKMNASASYVEDGKYTISFNYAGYVMLYNFYKEYLHRKDFFSLVSSGKKVSEKLIEGYLTLLMDISIQLILFHELGHVFNGHLDYLAKEKNTLTLFESDSENLGRKNALMLQALEWNADEFAATHLMPFYQIDANCDSVYIQHPFIGSWLVLASAVTVFSFLGAGRLDDDKDSYKHKAHLPLRYRVMKILDSNMDCVETKNKYRFDFCSKDFSRQDLLIELEKYCDSYINANFPEFGEHNPYKNWDDFDAEHEKYYLEVDQFFMNQMTEAIEPYSYLITSQYSVRCNREYMGNEYYDELKTLLEKSVGIEYKKK